MKNVIIIYLFLFFIQKGYTQNYKTSLGLRFGYSAGITVKHFILERLALEGMITTRPSLISIKNPGAMITTLAEYHFFFKNISGFSLFVGGGIHGGYWGYVGSASPPYGYALLGIDAILGIEYSFPQLPLTIQIDLKPNVDFWEFIRWFPQEIFSVSARYYF